MIQVLRSKLRNSFVRHETLPTPDPIRACVRRAAVTKRCSRALAEGVLVVSRAGPDNALLLTEYAAIHTSRHSLTIFRQGFLIAALS